MTNSTPRFTTRFEVSGFVGSVNTDDAVFAQKVGQVFFQRPAPDRTPDAVYDVSVERRLGGLRRHIIQRDEQLVVFTGFYPSLFPALEREVVTSLGERPELCLVSAAALAAADRAFLLVGSSEIRNRVVRELLALRCQYYADGVTLLDRRDGTLVPFAKSVGHDRPRNPQVTRERRGAPFRSTDMTTTHYDPPPPPELVTDLPPRTAEVVLFFDGDKSTKPETKPMSRGEGLGRWLSNVHAETLDEQAFDLLHGIATRCDFWSVRPGRFRATAQAVLDVITGNDQRTVPTRTDRATL